MSAPVKSGKQRIIDAINSSKDNTLRRATLTGIAIDSIAFHLDPDRMDRIADFLENEAKNLQQYDIESAADAARRIS